MRRSKIIIFLVWASIWALYDIRPLIKDGCFREYVRLIGRPQKERRAVVYGKDLMEFLDHAGKEMPEGSTYKLVGLGYGPVDTVRAYYYLYPDIISERPRFILVYKTAGFKESGYSLSSSMDEESYVLKAD